MTEPQEIEDEEHEQVLQRVAAVDVAKDSGKVCVRVPHESKPGRRVSRVWDVDATTARSSSWVITWCARGSRR